MSFRLEDKLLINNDQLGEFIYWIKKNQAFEIYPPREILSLYFENSNNDIFLDSEEGCVPRKKIRVRTYPNDTNLIYNLEIKINSSEGRYKSSKTLNNESYKKLLNSGFVDKLYGTCFPKVYIRYYRKYFFLWDSRITIDNKINYKSFFSDISSYKDNDIIVEIKSNDTHFKEKLINLFPFQRHRFSKYCKSYNYI